MTDIHGNPDITDLLWYAEERDYRFEPCYSCEPRGYLPFPYLAQDTVDGALALLYAVFAALYGFGCLTFLPRTGWHHAAVAAGGGLSLLAAACWPAVKRIPAIGPARLAWRVWRPCQASATQARRRAVGGGAASAAATRP
jgi:hypothetical protein